MYRPNVLPRARTAPSRGEGVRRKEIHTGEGSVAAEATQDFVDKPPARAPEGRAGAAAAQPARLPEAASA